MYCERFDPTDENCMPLAADAVTDFFEYELSDISIVKNIKSIRDLIAYFESVGLRIDGFYHPIFLLNPKYWLLFRKKHFHSIKKINKIPNGEKYACVYFTSGFELYGVHEFWNHVVVEFYGEERTYYDRYLEIVNRTYPQLTAEIPTHEFLVNKIASICFVVRRRA